MGILLFTISGYPSMSGLFVDTFFEFAVVENCAFAARIRIIFSSEAFSITSSKRKISAVSKNNLCV